MKNNSILVTFILLAIFSANSFANKVLYIQSAKANMLDKPSFAGKSIAKFLKGTVVEVINTKNNWIEVKSGNQQGWIVAMLLSKTPPLSKASLFEKLSKSKKDSNTTSVRTRASIQATAAATRGLRTRTIANKIIDEKNYRSVLAVESIQVTVHDVLQFHNNLSKYK